MQENVQVQNKLVSGFCVAAGSSREEKGINQAKPLNSPLSDSIKEEEERKKERKKERILVSRFNGNENRRVCVVDDLLPVVKPENEETEETRSQRPRLGSSRWPPLPPVPPCLTGAVSSATGSAYVELDLGQEKAMLYSDVGRLNCNVSYTTFATSVRGQGSDHKEYSSTLHKALEGAIILESFPKTTVDVFALVLESCGNDLPLVVSCASLALADAGIMMYD
ncbi:Exosome complex component RRP41-like-like protein, partial [Drosera capensis]